MHGFHGMETPQATQIALLSSAHVWSNYTSLPERRPFQFFKVLPPPRERHSSKDYVRLDARKELMETSLYSSIRQEDFKSGCRLAQAWFIPARQQSISNGIVQSGLGFGNDCALDAACVGPDRGTIVEYKDLRFWLSEAAPIGFRCLVFGGSLSRARHWHWSARLPFAKFLAEGADAIGICGADGMIMPEFRTLDSGPIRDCAAFRAGCRHHLLKRGLERRFNGLFGSFAVNTRPIAGFIVIISMIAFVRIAPFLG